MALLLSGCAPVHYPNVPQPRMQQWGVSLPRCIAVCIATATVTDAEQGAATTNVTENLSDAVTVTSTKGKE